MKHEHDPTVAVAAAITLACCVAFACAHPPSWASWAFAGILFSNGLQHRVTRAAIREDGNGAPEEAVDHG